MGEGVGAPCKGPSSYDENVAKLKTYLMKSPRNGGVVADPEDPACG